MHWRLISLGSDCMSAQIQKAKSLVAFYDREKNTFQYHKDLESYFNTELQGKLLWDALKDAGLLSVSNAEQICAVCHELDQDHSFYTVNVRFSGKGQHSLTFAYHQGTVTITIHDLAMDFMAPVCGRIDELTALLDRNSFCEDIEEIISSHPGRKFAVYFFDVEKFKAINDMFGFAEGDKLLIYISNKIKTYSDSILCGCRLSADRFCFLADITEQSPDSLIDGLVKEIRNYDLPFDIICNVGICLVTGLDMKGNTLLDKAMIAQQSVKGYYTRKVCYYTEDLRDQMLTEQEIAGAMNAALSGHQFVVYYQPQYNHSTGMIIGAEALVRWIHPNKGLISPGVFIPIFEKNGFISLSLIHI